MYIKNKIFISLLFVSAFFGQQLVAQVSLPKVLGHGMVLQRRQPVPIWGYAAAGEKVTVQFAGQQEKATADASGNWHVTLNAMEAAATGRPLTITGTNKIQLNDILVGEVWLCSGQSNMEFTMRKYERFKDSTDKKWVAQELQNASNPSIRLFLTDRKRMKPDSTHAGWSIAADSALRQFSAVGYFFAKKLQQELKVPVGIIASSIPGSRIEPWAPAEAFEKIDWFKNNQYTISGDPGKFYSTIIEPLAPFALKGFLWYQGESNCFLKDRIAYAYKMEALIKQWRSVWNNPKLPFYFVQIAPYVYSATKDNVVLDVESLPEFREVQAIATNIPYTGMVVTTDLNDNIKDLHPYNKWDIGKRLALMALSNTYQSAIAGSGPVFNTVTFKQNLALLSFNHTGKGLVAKDNKPLSCFTIAGADGHFVPATAVISGNQVIVSSPAVAKPVAVRLGWNEADHPNLFNKDGLPAVPFQTNNPLLAEWTATHQ